jgi:hypothetical protein
VCPPGPTGPQVKSKSTSYTLITCKFSGTKGEPGLPGPMGGNFCILEVKKINFSSGKR